MTVPRTFVIVCISMPLVGFSPVYVEAPAQDSVPATPLQPASSPGNGDTAGDKPTATTNAPQQPPRKAIYDEAADAKKQIAAALTAAGKNNRRVLLQWGANWCGWCHKLHDTCAANADLKKQLSYEYDVVLIDIGKWDKNMDLAASYGADLKANGVPYLTVLDAQGEAIANQETGSLEKDGAHDPEKVLAFLKQHQAEYPAAESVLSEGMSKAAAENKIVFLHFGAPWCGWCHRLENWLARPEVASVLARDFIDVKIDEDRTIGGKELEAKYAGKGKSKGIPWFAFVDPRTGEAIITSDDASGANIGFPAKESEIAHFGAMLRKAGRNITPEEIEKLLASLEDASKKAS